MIGRYVDERRAKTERRKRDEEMMKRARRERSQTNQHVA